MGGINGILFLTPHLMTCFDALKLKFDINYF